MIGSGGTFFMAWLGAYDFLAHYARGGDENVFPEPTAATVVGPQLNRQYRLCCKPNMERCRWNST